MDDDNYRKAFSKDNTLNSVGNTAPKSFNEYLRRNLEKYDDPLDGIVKMGRDSCLKNRKYFEITPISDLVPREVVENYLLKYLPNKKCGYIVSDFLRYIYFEYCRKYETQYFKENLDTLSKT